MKSAFIHSGRFLKVCGLTLLFVIAFPLRRLRAPSAGPRLLRWYLQHCGAGFVKFGQILAMRYDLLPEAYCHELGKLLDRLPPFEFERAKAIIEGDLKRPLSECFQTFDPVPIGSASIAQVYRARLWNDERVAVKVRRPNIEHYIRQDLRMMRALAWLVDSIGLLVRVRLKGLVSVYTRLALEELDFRREARSAQLLHERMASDSVDHRAPRIHFDLSGPRVFTAEFFEGVWMRELLTAVEQNDRAKLDAFAARGITPERTARLLLRSIMEQAYHHRVFHADPHAANLVLLDGGTLGYVDFGMVGWLDERMAAQQYRLYDAISRGKIHASYEAMLDTLEPLTTRDLGPFQTEFKALLRDWLVAAHSPHATIEEKSTGRFMLRASDAIRRCSLQMPWDTMRLQRTTMISDMIELKLFPDFDVAEAMREFFEIELGRQFQERMSADEVSRNLRDIVQVSLDAPQTLRNLIAWAESRLPDTLRDIRRDFSRFEQVTNLSLHFLRLAGWIATGVFAVAMLGSLVVPETVMQSTQLESKLPGFLANLRTLKLAGLTLGSALLSLFLGLIINWFEDSD